jgi:sugar phosphate isomerase/epimerase
MLTYSVWSSYFIKLSPEEMVREFLSAGFTATEFSDEHGAMMLRRGKPETEGRKLKEYADALGFSFPQGHLLLAADLCAPDAVEILKPWIDLFAALGVRSGVLHASGGADLTPEERFERRVWALSELTAYVRGSDFTICLENLRGATRPETAEDLNALIDAVGSDANLGICLDTGHLHILKDREESQRDFIRIAGRRLKALHIADNDTTGDMHLMPYGRGTIDWPEVLDALRGAGYDRLFNLEIPGENRCPLPVLRAKLRYCRELCEILLSSAGL